MVKQKSVEFFLRSLFFKIKRHYDGLVFHVKIKTNQQKFKSGRLTNCFRYIKTNRIKKKVEQFLREKMCAVFFYATRRTYLNNFEVFFCIQNIFNSSKNIANGLKNQIKKICGAKIVITFLTTINSQQIIGKNWFSNSLNRVHFFRTLIPGFVKKAYTISLAICKVFELLQTTLSEKQVTEDNFKDTWDEKFVGYGNPKMLLFEGCFGKHDNLPNDRTARVDFIRACNIFIVFFEHNSYFFEKNYIYVNMDGNMFVGDLYDNSFYNRLGKQIVKELAEIENASYCVHFFSDLERFKNVEETSFSQGVFNLNHNKFRYWLLSHNLKKHTFDKNELCFRGGGLG